MEEKKEIIDLILGVKSEEGRKSTLQLALKQARKIIGKKDGGLITKQSFQERRKEKCGHLVNVENGDTVDLEGNQIEDVIVDIQKAMGEEEMDILTSLSLYLIVLDQLGHIFGERNNNSNKIQGALIMSKKDGELGPEIKPKRETIANLRNSINHNFGLACFNPQTNIGKEKYILDIGKDDGKQSPVNLAINIWQGNWCDKSEKTSTTIYPLSLMNYIEEVLESYVDMHNNGEIESPLCAEELKTRFTIVMK